MLQEGATAPLATLKLISPSWGTVVTGKQGLRNTTMVVSFTFCAMTSAEPADVAPATLL